MATPTITWKKYTGTANTGGSTIVEATLGSVTAGSWSDNKCLGVAIADESVYNLRFWLANGNAVVNLASVNLGATGKVWDFRGKVVASIVGQGALFAGSGGAMSVGNELATVYRSVGCGINHAGANRNTVTSGLFLGATGVLGSGTTSYVSSGKKSKPVFLSIMPSTLAASGDYTQFAFQVGYDFA